MKIQKFMLCALALAAAHACSKAEGDATNSVAETATLTASSDTMNDPAIVTPDERAAMIDALGFEAAAGGQVMNDCGEAVTPDVYAADLGGDVGRALLLVIMGGPNTISCYGMTGMQFFLFRLEGSAWSHIFTDFGHFAPMPTSHNGVKDFAVGGPGFEFPVYEWTGAEFTSKRIIPDTELPASIN